MLAIPKYPLLRYAKHLMSDLVPLQLLAISNGVARFNHQIGEYLVLLLSPVYILLTFRFHKFSSFKFQVCQLFGVKN
jgi:hypothetical protein